MHRDEAAPDIGVGSVDSWTGPKGPLELTDIRGICDLVGFIIEPFKKNQRTFCRQDVPLILSLSKIGFPTSKVVFISVATVFQVLVFQSSSYDNLLIFQVPYIGKKAL